LDHGDRGYSLVIQIRVFVAGLGDGRSVFQDVVNFSSRATQDIVSDAEIPEERIWG
jgi:hypothetical protein